ncbi:MAG: glycosyltransferase [Anaerolineales bacterium]|nr:glycosyltransferase [Anaerolineales bacterium]
MRLLITVDALRNQEEVEIPHAYATQVEYLKRTGNEVLLFGVNDRTTVPGVFRNARELREAIISFRPDLIVAYYGTMVAAITRLASGRLPYIVTFRGSDLLGSSNYGWKWKLRDLLGRLLSLWAAAGARQIVVNGNGLFNSLPVMFRRKTHNIPNGINTNIFSPIQTAVARHQLGWSSADKVILFNAGVDSGQVVKNRPLAERVVSSLQKQIPEIRLEAISTCTQEEVALRMNASDCLLMTSLHEGSPDLIKEAMACNLPVVSVPCGDVHERLAETTPGSIQPYEVGALTDAIGEVIHVRRRSNGREQLFLQELDIVSVTGRVLSVYRSAAFRDRNQTQTNHG